MLWLALVVVASCGLVYGSLKLAPGDETSFGGTASQRDFVAWLDGAARGELGESSSYRAGAGVSELLRPAIGESLKSPDIQKPWNDDLVLDMPPPGRAGFDQFLAEDRKLWEPAVKASGVKLD